MGGKSLIDEQRLALGHWMGAYDGMRRLRKNLATVVAPYQHIGRTIDVLARMRSREPFEIGLHARRQRILGCILARKHRTCADWRYGVELEKAAPPSLLVAGPRRIAMF